MSAKSFPHTIPLGALQFFLGSDRVDKARSFMVRTNGVVACLGLGDARPSPQLVEAPEVAGTEVRDQRGSAWVHDLAGIVDVVEADQVGGLVLHHGDGLGASVWGDRNNGNIVKKRVSLIML